MKAAGRSIICLEDVGEHDDFLCRSAKAHQGEIRVTSVSDMVSKVLAAAGSHLIRRLYLLGHGASGDQSVGSGRDFAAWLGMTRRNHDTGGKHSLTGKISRAGDEAVRKLLVLGASAHLRRVRSKPEAGSAWIKGVLARRPVKVAVVAQAAKTARILWAMLRSGQQYRAPAAA